ncbi:ABC transporter permease [Paenibacillus chibensis]|uniref:ABC transporter permease n=1 Tax=Paenibacillus chibensis TaxID=59846 RepID=A0ABU6PQR5_9BACL|nr:ABC transporter permease [Paenibacillus chibensis]
MGTILKRELSGLGMQRAMAALMVVFGILLPIAASWYLGSSVSDDATAAEQVYMWRVVAVVMCFMPSFLPAALSATNLAGEFEMRTLVPLLATPVSNRSLFTGKMLSILLPAFAVVLLSQAVFYIGTYEVQGLPGGASWTFYAVLLTSSIAYYFLVVSIGFIIAVKVREIRNSQQYGALCMMPVMLGSMGGLGYSVVKFSMDSILYVTLPAGLLVLLAALMGLPKLWNRSRLAERF